MCPPTPSSSSPSSSSPKSKDAPERTTRTLERRISPLTSSSPPWLYYREKLHQLAPFYWGHFASSDCKLVLYLDADKVLVYNLHMGYLVPQSKLLQDAFLGRPSTIPMFSPIEEEQEINNGLPSPPPSPAFPSGEIGVRRDLSFEQPTVVLQLPDRSSFDLILHYMYWGDKLVVERALDEGRVSCEGLLKNVAILGLDSSLKKLIGQYWTRTHPPPSSCSTFPRPLLTTPPFSESGAAQLHSNIIL